MANENQKKGCHYRYENAIGDVFGRYGRFVASGPKKPWIILGICVLVNLALGAGFHFTVFISDSESLYAPRGSQSLKDKKTILSLFEDRSADNFYGYSLLEFGYFAEVLIRTKNDENILTTKFLNEIKSIDSKIRAIVSSHSGKTYNFTDVCALREGECVVFGDVVFTPEFESKMLANNITYPVFGYEILSGTFGSIQVSNGIMKRATIVKLVYNLKSESTNSKAVSQAWEQAFIAAAKSFSSANTEISYQVSDSVDTALEETTVGDTIFFIATISLMIAYASVAGIAVSLNCVTWRALLSMAGILAAVLAILSSFGLMGFIGMQFVDIVAVMPFLIVGKGQTCKGE